MAFLMALTSSVEPALADPLTPPTIDLQFIVTYPAGGDETAPPGNARIDGNVRAQGSVTEAIGKQLSVSYDHLDGGFLETTMGRDIARNGSTIVNGSIHDVINQVRVDGSLHQFNAELGYFYRERTCCPGTTDPANLAPADWHETYLTLGYTAVPIGALQGTTFSYAITGHHAPHHVTQAYLASLPSGFSDANRTETGLTQALGLTTPLDTPHTLTIGGSYSWGAMDYFDNAPLPFYYSDVIVTGRKSVNKVLSITALLNNLTQRNQGYPFASRPGDPPRVLCTRCRPQGRTVVASRM
jgi:hypothetical protein